MGFLTNINKCAVVKLVSVMTRYCHIGKGIQELEKYGVRTIDSSEEMTI